MKNSIICGCICGLLIVGTLGAYLHYNKKEDNKREVKEKIEGVILKEDLSAEFLSEVKVSDFIASMNGSISDDYYIDTKILGEKEIEYEYINKDNKKENGVFTITIKDTVAPVIWLGASYSVNVNSNIDLTKKIMCGDNYDSKPKCEIIGEYDLNKVGTYPLTYKATDSSGNVAEQKFNLNVTKPSESKPPKKTETLFSDVVKKYKNENTEIGLDISEWQDYPDFNKLKKAGVEFVILRVGGSKLKTGDYFLDKSFKYNIEEANKAGIPVGIYFYSYANNKERALKDAQWIYDQIKDYKVSLPIAFDWENWSFYNDFELSFYELTDMSNSFLKFFEDKGYEGVLYSSKSYLEEIWLKSNYPIWMAHYTRNLEMSSYKGEYDYWQLCSDGKVDGVDGAVDINIRYKN